MDWVGKFPWRRDRLPTPVFLDFLGGSDSKESTCNGETWVPSLDWEDPWRRAWQPTPVALPGKSPWTEEPGGLQPWGRKDSDTTERLSTHSTYPCPLHPEPPPPSPPSWRASQRRLGGPALCVASRWFRFTCSTVCALVLCSQIIPPSPLPTGISQN